MKRQLDPMQEYAKMEVHLFGGLYPVASLDGTCGEWAREFSGSTGVQLEEAKASR